MNSTAAWCPNWHRARTNTTSYPWWSWPSSKPESRKHPDFGLKNAQENLATVIGAGYIEDFGQKKFTELSPRTLIRYLENFRRDANLRRRMLELSRQEMIVRPDAQLFYEFNIKLLRSLYGESYIDQLRDEKLRQLGS